MTALTDGERVLSRARSLMANGKAKSWSHAIELAGDTLGRPVQIEQRVSPIGEIGAELLPMGNNSRSTSAPPSHALASFPTRETIDQADELDWTPRPQAELQVTITAVVDGFAIEVRATLDQVRSATRKLRELGAQALIAPPIRK